MMDGVDVGRGGASDFRPMQKRTAKIVEYERRKKARGALMRKKPQIIELLHQTLGSKEFKEYLVYPHEGDETVIERNQMDEPILIVMTGKHAATLVKNFGQ